MRAAERLIARKGIENVTIREIVAAAGQKNESALQYHFDSLGGLIAAIHADRGAEVQAARGALIDALYERTASPSLRDVCHLMVAPAFQLAKGTPGFRHYIRAFGHEITVTDEPALALLSRQGGGSARELTPLLRAALSHLDDDAYGQRLDAALRFAAASMVNHARQRDAFKGPGSEWFFMGLVDALVGLLGAPESDATRAAR